MDDFFPVQCVDTLRRIAVQVKQARLKQAIRQVDISERLGVSLRAYRLIEKGDPGVSLRDFMLVLWNLGLSERIFQSLKDDPSFSSSLEQETAARRVRLPKSSPEDF
ncbi:MAG: transcriptional regulator [Pseudomonas sp.]